ncbi:E3 SUMO-protein ligase ZBED1-like [Lampris incognitus]|uniref:E3 SUMO-protein ligase ZBED1-like n=1 Tax=Lampris incognitus TaxID=2546036 RepID=UPI0024B5882B|nr:E3 SUMO-protein ligase ZBED1-like [Lampris incognitus]
MFSSAKMPKETPRIVRFAYTDFTTNSSKITARCSICKRTIEEKTGTTSNFNRHLSRMHPEKFQEYRASTASDVMPAASGQKTITSFLNDGQQRMYDLKHPRQKAISDALVKDLIIKCCLPLSIVDNEDFKHFLHVLDPQYRPIARSTISSVTIPGMVEVKKEQIKNQLAEASSVAVTTDIWSDRKMRSFLGVTAHTVAMDKKKNRNSAFSHIFFPAKECMGNTQERRLQ